MEHDIAQNLSQNDLMKIVRQLKQNFIPQELVFEPIDLSICNERFLVDYCKSIDICYENLSPYTATLLTFQMREVISTYRNHIYIEIYLRYLVFVRKVCNSL